MPKPTTKQLIEVEIEYQGSYCEWKIKNHAGNYVHYYCKLLGDCDDVPEYDGICRAYRQPVFKSGKWPNEKIKRCKQCLKKGI